jgi:hypothetical protein
VRHARIKTKDPVLTVSSIQALRIVRRAILRQSDVGLMVTRAGCSKQGGKRGKPTTLRSFQSLKSIKRKQSARQCQNSESAVRWPELRKKLNGKIRRTD